MRPWQPAPMLAGAAVLAVGTAISGLPGLLVAGGALGVRYVLRDRERWRDNLTVAVAAGGLILAGATLSQYPWRSVDGYVGHSPWVQLLALLSVTFVAASTVTPQRTRERTTDPVQEPAPAPADHG